MTTADNSPAGLRRNLLRLYVAPFIVFSLLVACTMFIANGQYRLDTSEHRAETLQVIGATFVVLNFATAAWSLLTEGSARTLFDIMSGTTVVTTRSMLPEHIKIRKQGHFGVTAFLLFVVLVLLSTGFPAFIAQREMSGKMTILEEERVCVPALCLMGITNKAEWFQFQDTAAETLKDTEIYARMEGCTHKLLEKTEIVPGMTTFQQSTTTTQSVDIQPLCAEKMNYKHEIHELFEHFVKPVRAWMGLAESTASHPERLMRTALQFFTDTDYDGSIDKDEFMTKKNEIVAMVKEMFEKQGKSTANIEERVVEEFNDLDTNNDGQVDQNEFLSRDSAIAGALNIRGMKVSHV